jgi:phage shock protein A
VTSATSFLGGGELCQTLGATQSQTALWVASFFRAYLEEKKLVGAKHNYKYECKQLRATVRYLHRKIDELQNQVAMLRALCDVYLKEDL